ncbi:MAG TPA: DUF1080 domain-containing protein, partial [Balneolales bacterium]|nr:DUF1080 domain-containing protein [Balneolales bacterium]
MNYRKIFQLLIIVSIGSLFASVSNAQQLNKLTAKEKMEGWHLLFNGKNLNGWHSYLEKHPGKDWSVQDHSIRLKKSKKDQYGAYADLITDKVYKNFDLRLEWKMNPGVDSGVMIYVHESPKYSQTYETGPEIQIADLFGTKPDSRVLKERAADIFGLIPVDTEQV